MNLWDPETLTLPILQVLFLCPNEDRRQSRVKISTQLSTGCGTLALLSQMRVPSHLKALPALRDHKQADLAREEQELGKQLGRRAIDERAVGDRSSEQPMSLHEARKPR